MRRTIVYHIPPVYDGRKVIHYLRGAGKLSSRMVITLKNLPDGILLNGAPTRTIDRLKAGDTLEIRLPEEECTIAPQPMVLDMVYEDEDLLVINKPANLAMHPTHNHQGDTLANGVAAYLLSQGRAATFRAVGRLDKCTSGLVLCALNGVAAAALAGRIEKSYLALPTGCYRGTGVIDKTIIRPDPMKTLRAVGEGGEYAVTTWEALVSGARCSLVRVRPLTGRTHQIRVHFASMGTPLLGDDMYGGSRELIDRAALHCASLEFVHPISGQTMYFSCPVPPDMQKAMSQLGLSAAGVG